MAFSVMADQLLWADLWYKRQPRHIEVPNDGSRAEEGRGNPFVKDGAHSTPAIC